MRQLFVSTLMLCATLRVCAPAGAEEAAPAKPSFAGSYVDEHFGTDTLTITLGKPNADGNLTAVFAGAWEGDVIAWEGWLSPIKEEGEVRGYCEEPMGDHKYELSGSWKTGTLRLKYETGTMTLTRAK